MKLLVLASLFALPLWPAPAGRAAGYLVSARLGSGSELCAPGDVCATATLYRHNCYFVNVQTPHMGGSPLAIDSTQTGTTSATSVYWVNDTNQPVAVRGAGDAYYECAP